MPGGTRHQNHSVLSAFGVHYGVLGSSWDVFSLLQESEMLELREPLKGRQQQLCQVIQSVALLQNSVVHFVVVPSYVDTVSSLVILQGNAIGYEFLPVPRPNVYSHTLEESFA